MKTFKNWVEAQRGKSDQPLVPSWKKITVFIIAVLGAYVILVGGIFMVKSLIKNDAPEVVTASGSSGATRDDFTIDGATITQEDGDKKFVPCATLEKATWAEEQAWEVGVVCGKHEGDYPKYEYIVSEDALLRNGVLIPAPEVASAPAEPKYDLTDCDMIYDPNITMVWDFIGDKYTLRGADGIITETVRTLEDPCQAWSAEVGFAELPNNEQFRLLEKQPNVDRWVATQKELFGSDVPRPDVEVPAVEAPAFAEDVVDVATGIEVAPASVSPGLEPKVVSGQSGAVMPMAVEAPAVVSAKRASTEVTSAVLPGEAIVSTAVSCPEGVFAQENPLNGNCSVATYRGQNVPDPETGNTTIWTCPESINPLLDPTNGHCAIVVLKAKPAPVVEAVQTTAVSCPEGISAQANPLNGHCVISIWKGVFNVPNPAVGTTTVWTCPESINPLSDPNNGHCSILTLAGK